MFSIAIQKKISSIFGHILQLFWSHLCMRIFLNICEVKPEPNI